MTVKSYASSVAQIVLISDRAEVEKRVDRTLESGQDTGQLPLLDTCRRLGLCLAPADISLVTADVEVVNFVNL